MKTYEVLSLIAMFGSLLVSIFALMIALVAL